MASKYVCFCQYIKKRPISKTNCIISYRSINESFGSYQRSKSKSKMVPLIKSEVQLVKPHVVSFCYSSQTDLNSFYASYPAGTKKNLVFVSNLVNIDI